jgi:hypothetical protein
MLTKCPLTTQSDCILIGCPIGFCFSKVGDWLQGPHVYALYESYSMTKHDIELLFIAGFGSSMLFGTIIGSFADK